MTRMVLYALSIYTLTILCAGAFHPVAIDIGGPRKVNVMVSIESSKVICSVSFLPVSCFDTSLNRMVNQRKSRAYARLAMAKATGIQGGGVSTTTLNSVTPLEMKGERVYVTYHADFIKSADVRETPSFKSQESQEVAQAATNDNKELVTDLFSCEQETRATIHAMNEALEHRISQIKVGENLENTVADLESGGTDAFDKLFEETKNEKLLLQIEKNSLLEGIKLSRKIFLKNLAKAYAMLEKPDKSAN